MKNLKPIALALALIATAQALPAKDKIDPVPPIGARSETFQRAHQDMKWRRVALAEYNKADYDDALDGLLKAAQYGDKPSQALIAEMYWNGTGVAEDRARAYAWMDLAAERRYQQFVAKREYYWMNLSPSEQNHALRIGEGLYAQYGDSVALPRMDKQLTKVYRERTGSRFGSVGNMKVLARMDNGEFAQFRGDRFYREQYWVPELYHQWKDAFWENPYGGEVDIGDIRKARIAAEKPSVSGN